jgi:hypothetical protein
MPEWNACLEAARWAGTLDMAALIGKRVEFVESHAGFVVQVAVVGDEATTEESDG